MMIFNPSMVAGGALTLASCLLYREIQRAVLSSKLFVPKPPNPPTVSARLAVAGLICESKREDFPLDDLAIAREHAELGYEDLLIVDAEFDEIPSMPVRPPSPSPRPLVYQEDGKPLMYVDSNPCSICDHHAVFTGTDTCANCGHTPSQAVLFTGSLDALKGSAHGAWMDRKGDN